VTGQHLTDSAGTATDTYSYDVYGAVRAQTGTTNNDFRFTGEQADDNANRGLYYLRARHYDPALGRFLSKDPVPFVNRYAYVDGNPVNLSDPSGLCYRWLGAFCDPTGRSRGGDENHPIEEIAERTKDSLTSAGTNVSGVVYAAGYVDVNATFCLPGLTRACGSGGLLLSPTTRPHVYAGLGAGRGASVSASWAPGQRPTPGRYCSATATYKWANVTGTRTWEDNSSGKESTSSFGGSAGIGLGGLFGVFCGNVW
jgi:RHS repeat-associated protein